jgi:indolepyruvate ferredoxin oxidoreductase beta subunit
MEQMNIILAGVGGQGILSIAYVIGMAARKRGLNVKQAEVHGMAQRGGAVQSHLRIASGPIASDLIPLGQAHLILAVEPLEALRYVQYLRPDGMIVASTTPVADIPDYPPLREVLAQIASVGRHLLVHSERVARAAGNLRTQNIAMLGAATLLLDLPAEDLAEVVSEMFARKGESVVTANVRALQLGRKAGQHYQSCLDKGMSAERAREMAVELPVSALQ